MSLQIWLPLNGDLHNQGIKDVSITNNGAVINNNGKIGKCYQFGTGTSYLELPSSSMTSFSDCSVTFWIKIISWNTSYCTFFQAGKNAYSWSDYIFGFLRNGSSSRACFTVGDGSTSTSASFLTSNLELNTWYHVTLTYKQAEKCSIYINGKLDHEYNTTRIIAFDKITKIRLGCSNGNAYQTNCLMNDFRIYNHCLSPLEVKKVVQGLILHYPLNRCNYGQENLLLNSNVEKSGKSNVAQWFRWNLNNLTLTTNIDYTLSFDAKISNSDVFYIGLANNDSTQEVLAQGVSVTTKYKRYIFTKRTSKTNINSIIVSNYKGYGRGNNNNTTGILYIKNIKLEIGNKNTPWCPNSSEILYNTLGLNNNIQYDISGYQNNGTKHNITYDSDTSKYEVSSIFTSANNSYIKVNDNNWMSQGTEEMTINLWINPATSFSKFFSCTESGGWNTEAGSSGYLRFPIHVYTNSGKTSTAYKYDSQQLKISDIPLNEWTMITFVYDKTGTYTYINGQLHHTCSFTSYGIHYNTNARLFLGCEASTASPGSPYFNGKMSDFRIYTTVLSAEDILSLYNNEAEIDQFGIIHGQIR